ncbi:MAG: metallophosphoesterase [Vicinamibacterales bacterium]
MRALIVSDIHGNIDALTALDAWMAREAPFDAVWVLGDLVDYGAAPADVIAWVRTHATAVVRGNHDHAVAFDTDCGSSPQFLPLSVATRRYFRARLDPADLEYLGGLPLRAEMNGPHGGRTVLVHATPADPLLGYLAADAPEDAWQSALRAAQPAAFVLLGHTHVPCARRIGATTVINPGSLGFPTDGEASAAFAVLDDGGAQLRRVPYDTASAAARVEALPIDAACRTRIAEVLRRGRVT